MRKKLSFFYWNFIIKNLFSILTTTRSLSLWLEFSSLKLSAIAFIDSANTYFDFLLPTFFSSSSFQFHRNKTICEENFLFFYFIEKRIFYFLSRIFFFIARWIHTEVDSLCVSICIIKVKFYFVDIGNLNCKFSLFLLTTYVLFWHTMVHPLWKAFIINIFFHSLHPSNVFLRYITSEKNSCIHVDMGFSRSFFPSNKGMEKLNFYKMKLCHGYWSGIFIWICLLHFVTESDFSTISLK